MFHPLFSITRPALCGLMGALLFTALPAAGQTAATTGAQATSFVAPRAAADFRSRVEQVYFNGKALVFDESSLTYFCPLPSSLRGGADLTLHITAQMKPGAEGYTLRFEDWEPAADGSVTVKHVNCTRTYGLSLLSEDAQTAVGSVRVAFTFLPLVEVNVASCNADDYTRGSLRVTDPDTEGQDQTWVADYRYRGSSALGYNKKSYAVKLRDAGGESADGSFFGLREDNNWILDAMAVDRSCMRNRVSTDLWNDFATEPYYQRDGREDEGRTGTRGRFVELFLNGSYHGLYCMTEKMDRKQLKLKKYKEAEGSDPDEVRGTLYKSSQWSYEVLMGHEPDVRSYPGRSPRAYDNNNRLETWADYEVKYPDYEEERIDWGPLWRAINFVATSSDEQFADSVGEYFDRPVLDDYYLFIELMLATDNHGKNMYFFNYNIQEEADGRKMGIAPWDLDGTWGRRWDGSSELTGPSQDFETYLWAHEHGTFTLYDRLAASRLQWREALAARYAQLREGYFSEASLTNRFRTYAELFAESGTDSREARRWPAYHPDLQADVDYICDWIGQRLEWLDAQYGYEADAIGSAPQTAGQLTAEGGKGCIVLRSAAPVEARIYGAAGRLRRSVRTAGAATRVEGLTPGVYVVAGQKVLVR